MKINKFIRSLKDRFMNAIWKTPLDELPFIKNRLITGVRIIHLVLRDLMDGMITLRAMSLVYTTILALVPLLAVSFSVLKGFGVHNQIEPMLLNLLQPLGEKSIEITSKVIEFVNNTKAGVLGALGLTLLMYTVVSLLQKIESAFNYTWRLQSQRSISRRFSDYLTVIFVGPVLLFSALGVTASISSFSIMQDAMEIETIGFMVKLLGYLIPYLLVICAFTFIYVFIPNTKVKIGSALVGAFVSGVLWETSSWAFAAFVVNSTKYTAIYSAFATLIIFFIWLYINWLILLIGSSIAYYHQHPEHCHLGSRIVRLSNRLREIIALNIMMLIGKYYQLRQPAWTIDALSQHMRVSSEVCVFLVDRLVKAEMLVKTSSSPTAYLPICDPYSLSLNEIIHSIRKFDESDAYAFDKVNIEPETKATHSNIEQAITDTLKQRSLGELYIKKN